MPTCLNASCGDTFVATHGNSRYCCRGCSQKVKIETQRRQNSLMKRIRRGVLGNHKLFSQLLPASGSIEVPLHRLLNANFDPDGYYGTFIDKQRREWKRVSEYYFRVAKVGDQPFL